MAVKKAMQRAGSLLEVQPEAPKLTSCWDYLARDAAPIFAVLGQVPTVYRILDAPLFARLGRRI